MYVELFAFICIMTANNFSFICRAGLQNLVCQIHKNGVNNWTFLFHSRVYKLSKNVYESHGTYNQ